MTISPLSRSYPEAPRCYFCVGIRGLARVPVPQQGRYSVNGEPERPIEYTAVGPGWPTLTADRRHVVVDQGSGGYEDGEVSEVRVGTGARFEKGFAEGEVWRRHRLSPHAASSAIANGWARMQAPRLPYEEAVQ